MRGGGAMDELGHLTREQFLEFIDVWRSNGDNSPLSGSAQEADRELHRRAARVLEAMKGLNENLDTAEAIVEQAKMLEDHVAPFLSKDLVTPCRVVLTPEETLCPKCNVYLISSAYGRPRKVLTIGNGVLEGDVLQKTCDSCQMVFRYATIEEVTPHHLLLENPDLPERVERYRENAHKLEYTLSPGGGGRGGMLGAFVVETALLVQHHSYNERVQISAFGETDALRAGHRMQSLPHAWCSVHNARTVFDSIYFLWLALRHQVHDVGVHPSERLACQACLPC